jgi:outer membrane immunogenic protein
MRKTALAAALLGALAATPAAAGSWTGCYLGGAAGYSALLTETSLDVAGTGEVASIDSLGAQGASLTGMVGCDVQVQKFVLGAFGAYTWDDVDFSVTFAGAPADVAHISLDSRWDIGARAGYLFTPTMLAYVSAGYTRAEISDVELPAFSLSLPTDELEGWFVGGGIETQLAGNLFLQASATYSFYDTENVPVFGPLSLNMDDDILTARAALLYRFSVPEADKLIPAAPLK